MFSDNPKEGEIFSLSCTLENALHFLYLWSQRRAPRLIAALMRGLIYELRLLILLDSQVLILLGSQVLILLVSQVLVLLVSQVLIRLVSQVLILLVWQLLFSVCGCGALTTIQPVASFFVAAPMFLV